MLDEQRTPTYHFFSYRIAIRYHIARCLQALGWQEAPNGKSADINDSHLTLNDEMAKDLEYKDRLAVLMAGSGVMPLTYCIDDDNYSEVFAKMIYEHYMPNHQYVANVPGLKWILKPATLNNGEWIRLFNNVDELKKYYASTQRLGGHHVIQQYIPNPDLIDGKKYTFRIHLVLTNFAGAFLYQQGYVNISAQPFDLENMANRKAHITNYVLDEDLSGIEQRSSQLLENFPMVYAQMQEIARTVIRRLLKKHPRFLKPQATQIFEIFGLDFILDQNQKLWLLEINQGPDAPMFEENHLHATLWKSFWQDIMESFVFSVTQQPSAKISPNFIQILTKSQCYSPWRALW